MDRCLDWTRQSQIIVQMDIACLGCAHPLAIHWGIRLHIRRYPIAREKLSKTLEEQTDIPRT